MRKILETKPTQVLENLTSIAIANGFRLPTNVDRKAWAERKLRPDLVSHKHVTKFLDSLLKTNKIREYFIKQLRKTLDPKKYGIRREWKQTQREALEAIIQTFEEWYTRPLIEVPTGIGKSMLWGAIVRAYYDTLRKFGLMNEYEIVIFTSRIHIADQMIGVSAKKSSANEIEDEPLEYGDVKMWLPKLSDDHIRILAGRSNSSKEAKKNAVLTIMCYQGLSPKTLDQIYSKKVGLGILDESHRATNRVRIVLDNKMPSAFFIGGSATTKGPAMNNPFKFFEAIQSGDENGRAPSYQERLAYCASILDCIERRELKPVRYINGRTRIDLSSLPPATRNLPEKAAGKLIAKNLPLMKQLLEELFLGDYPVLKVVGTKSVIDRKWLVFVERIKIAEKLAEFCNTELQPLLVKRYGKQLQFKADYVSGTMSINEFNERMINYRNNTTTIMFSSDKLGEGADVPEINGIFSLRAYGAQALWKAIQEMGRGVRHIEGDDLLMVDGIFKSQKHEIASALTIFGVNSYVNGGLVAGYSGERDVETKVFTLLKEGKTWKEVWRKLLKEEKELVPFIRQYLGEASGDSQTTANYEKPFSIRSIEFVENEVIKLKRDILTWQEASKICVKARIKNPKDYHARYSMVDKRLRRSPKDHYKDFPGWVVFLGKPIPPKDWRSKGQLVKDGFSPRQIVKVVKSLRKSNPQWFKLCSNDYCELVEYYHPKLVEKIRVYVSRIKYPPKDWISRSDLVKEINNISSNLINETAERLAKGHPNWFGMFLGKNSRPVQHYHPLLGKKIRNELSPIKKYPPKGWESGADLKKRGISYYILEKYCKKLRKSKPSWFKFFMSKRSHRVIEHYHPLLIREMINKEFEEKENAPKDWVTITCLSRELKVSYEVINKFIKPFRSLNPGWFGKYLNDHRFYAEYLHPALVKKVRGNILKAKVIADKDWLSVPEIMVIYKISRYRIQRLARVFIKKKKSWVKMILSKKTNKFSEHYHPKLVQKIEEHFAKKKK